MLSALNDVYGERETRGFVRLTATSLAFTLGGVFGLLLALGAILVLPLAFSALGLGGAYELAAKIVRWPVVALAIVGALALLYRFGPRRNLAKWRWVTWDGALFKIGNNRDRGPLSLAATNKVDCGRPADAAHPLKVSRLACPTLRDDR